MSSHDPLPPSGDPPPMPPPPPEGIWPGYVRYGVTLPEHLPPAPPPPPGAPLFRWAHPNFWWSIVWCIGYVLCTQVPGGVVAGLLLVGMMLVAPALVEPDAGNTSPMAIMQTTGGTIMLAVAVAVAHGLGILLSLAVLRLIVGSEWPRRVGLRRPSGLHLLLLVVGFPAMVLLANGAGDVLRSYLDLLRPQAKGQGLFDVGEIVKVFSSWPWGLAVLLVGVLPGIGEELWCRAFLGRGLVGRYGVVAGVLFASFFFGAIHVDPLQGTIAALLGLWLHFTYLVTRSLWAPILLHFLNNSLAVTALRFESLKALEDSPGAIPPYIFFTAALLLLAVGAALFQGRARLVAEDGGGPPPWQPDFPSVEWPPAGSGTRVACPWPTVGVAAATGVAFVAFVGACVAALR